MLVVTKTISSWIVVYEAYASSNPPRMIFSNSVVVFVLQIADWALVTNRVIFALALARFLDRDCGKGNDSGTEDSLI